MKILVKCIKLFDSGSVGEAPKGFERVFNILENTEFNGLYGHMNYKNFPIYAQKLCEKWNRQQPDNWKYELL